MLDRKAWFSSGEREELVELLRESERETLALIDAVSDAGWLYAPSSGGWSVSEIAEHLWISEGILLGATRAALGTQPNSDWQAKTRDATVLVWKTLTNRYKRVETPEIAKPKGGLNRAEAISRYGESRAETTEFVGGIDAPLKACTSEHFLFGTVSAYHWLLHLALHNQRHNQQILKATSNPDFPH